jgi:hypothetical protein
VWEGLGLQQMAVNSCHSIDSKARHHSQLGHVHCLVWLLFNDAQMLSDPAIIRPLVLYYAVKELKGRLSASVKQCEATCRSYASVDLKDDLQVSWQDVSKQLNVPTLAVRVSNSSLIRPSITLYTPPRLLATACG